MNNKPAVFVGSSNEGIEIAHAIQFQLRDDALVTIWDEGVYGIQEAASDVESLSERMAHLLALLTRSRILELEVISTQFGPLLPAGFVADLERDLRDLEAATKRKPEPE